MGSAAIGTVVDGEDRVATRNGADPVLGKRREPSGGHKAAHSKLSRWTRFGVRLRSRRCVPWPFTGPRIGHVDRGHAGGPLLAGRPRRWSATQAPCPSFRATVNPVRSKPALRLGFPYWGRHTLDGHPPARAIRAASTSTSPPRQEGNTMTHARLIHLGELAEEAAAYSDNPPWARHLAGAAADAAKWPKPKPAASWTPAFTGCSTTSTSPWAGDLPRGSPR